MADAVCGHVAEQDRPAVSQLSSQMPNWWPEYTAAIGAAPAGSRLPEKLSTKFAVPNSAGSRPIRFAAEALAATKYGEGRGVGISRVKNAGGNVANE